MGIPWYFKNIVDKYPSILSKNIPPECDRFFLDFNSIIHICSVDKATELEIFESIIDYVDNIVKICDPKKLLYIAVDGLAPLAKQVQQRKRRYLSIFRNNIINEYKKRNNISYSSWDSNCITPGTDFMKRLDKYLTNYYATKRYTCDIIFSGHNEEGEGEQKIIKYIRNFDQENIDIIYGLDADLIMLSLLCEKKNIYLMRDMRDKYQYLNIDILSYSIINKENMNIYDYIFVCFMLGNDFIPAIQFLKLKSGALDIIYGACKNNLEPIITKKDGFYSINKASLSKYMGILTEIEDLNMKELTGEYYSSSIRHNNYYKNKLEKFIHEFDNYPILNKYPLVIDPINNEKWRQQYYHHLFNDNNIDHIKNIVVNYIEGLLWTVNYYYNMKCDNGWYYKYNYSPSVQDIYKYIIVTPDIDEMQNKLLETKLNLTIEKQLLTVIPIMSIEVIPQELRKIYTKIEIGCTHYYPSKFCLGTYLKSAYHECVPLIPSINFDHLYSIIESN